MVLALLLLNGVACGASHEGRQWCSWTGCDSASPVTVQWCDESADHCRTCRGAWCGRPTSGPKPGPSHAGYCTYSGCHGTPMGGPFCNQNSGNCEKMCHGRWCAEPTPTPTVEPTVIPTTQPTVQPTTQPAPSASGYCTYITCNGTPQGGPFCNQNSTNCVGTCQGKWCADPTPTPTIEPTAQPTDKPTARPTAGPTLEPTTTPSTGPTTAGPTLPPLSISGYCTYKTCDGIPQGGPFCNQNSTNCVDTCRGKWCADPTPTPSTEPTSEPTGNPTTEPSVDPTGVPTVGPTMTPSVDPTATPTKKPTPPSTPGYCTYSTCDGTPQGGPFCNQNSTNCVDTCRGKWCADPTPTPTMEPTAEPTGKTTTYPTQYPTAEPTAEPTTIPTVEPTATPTTAPTTTPSTSGYCTYSTCDGTPQGGPFCSQNSTNCVKTCHGKWCADPKPTPTATPTMQPTGVPTPQPTAPDPHPSPTPGKDGYCTFNGCDGTPQGGPLCNENRVKCEEDCAPGVWCPYETPTPLPRGYCSFDRCDGSPQGGNFCNESQENCQQGCQPGRWCTSMFILSPTGTKQLALSSGANVE